MKPKWIIFEDEFHITFRLANIEFHKDLLPKTYKKVYGGGMFHYDKESDTLYLYHTSFDFGSVDPEVFKQDIWIQSSRFEHSKIKFSNEMCFNGDPLERITDWIQVK